MATQGLWKRPSVRNILFDLDETLMPERPTAERVVRSVCVTVENRYGIPADRMLAGLFIEARALWHAFELHPFCARIGISSWEGLWARFEGGGPDLERLRVWAPTYRREAWRRALQAHGIQDGPLAEQLAQRYFEERRRLHEVFPDVVDTLEELHGHYRLGILSNGASDLQREKIRAGQLERHFDVVVIAGDIGICKPAPEAFRHALNRLGARPTDTVFVGDSLEKDIVGAQGIGMRAIWVNRFAKNSPPDIVPDVEIASLRQLPALVGRDFNDQQ